MNKVYNSQKKIASEMKEFLLKSCEMKEFLLKSNPNIRKTQLKIIPFISLGMILSEFRYDFI